MHTHIATEPTWVICFSADNVHHNYNALEKGHHLGTGLDNMEVYATEEEADARYRDFDPVWKIGPFDINTASVEDLVQLPEATTEIAQAIVDNQPHWESTESLSTVDGVTPEMVSTWGKAVLWGLHTYEEPLLEPEPEMPV